MYDNITEHGHTINVMERMNIHQEVFLGILFRVFRVPFLVRRMHGHIFFLSIISNKMVVFILWSHCTTSMPFHAISSMLKSHYLNECPSQQLLFGRSYRKYSVFCLPINSSENTRPLIMSQSCSAVLLVAFALLFPVVERGARVLLPKYDLVAACHVHGSPLLHCVGFDWRMGRWCCCCCPLCR